MKISYLGGAENPTAVLDIGGQCQVRVEASPNGTVLHFDGPNGEISFRLTDQDWYALKDLVMLNRSNAGVFDWTKYCRGCLERNDFCPNGGKCEEKQEDDL